MNQSTRASPTQTGRFSSFADFYPYYLEQHANPTCRRLHVIGTALAGAVAVMVVTSHAWWWAPLVPACGYAFSWVGHFGFERNRPAAFANPWWSFLGDLKMLRDVVIGRVRW